MDEQEVEIEITAQGKVIVRTHGIKGGAVRRRGQTVCQFHRQQSSRRSGPPSITNSPK